MIEEAHLRACRRLDDGTAIYRVGEHQPAIRLDHFLMARIPKLSRRRIQAAIRGRVEVAGPAGVRRARPSMMLRARDRVIVRPSPPPLEAEPSDEIPILFQDDDVLVVDKPAGLLAHPSSNVRKGSVFHILSRDLEGPIHLVHRLDRETSGLMVIARSPCAARYLSEQIASRSGGMRKGYRAVVFGEMSQREMLIELPIGKAVRSAVYIKRGVNETQGRSSRTSVSVEACHDGFSLVRTWLTTGRRHQIRVHLAAVGHPVVGDKLYGPSESHYIRFITRGFDEKMRRELLTERQLLHAFRLEFRHPRDGRQMAFTADLPADMRSFAEQAGLISGGRDGLPARMTACPISRA